MASSRRLDFVVEEFLCSAPCGLRPTFVWLLISELSLLFKPKEVALRESRLDFRDRADSPSLHSFVFSASTSVCIWLASEGCEEGDLLTIEVVAVRAVDNHIRQRVIGMKGAACLCWTSGPSKSGRSRSPSSLMPLHALAYHEDVRFQY